jgi:hypothetical protein
MAKHGRKPLVKKSVVYPHIVLIAIFHINFVLWRCISAPKDSTIATGSQEN